MKQDQAPRRGGLAEARQQVHDSIQSQHPAWRDRHGECPPCARFEHELAAQTAGQGTLPSSTPTSIQ